MRTSELARNTAETSITLSLNLDGTGSSSIQTGCEDGITAQLTPERFVITGEGVGSAQQGVRIIKAVFGKNNMGSQILLGMAAF